VTITDIFKGRHLLTGRGVQRTAGKPLRVLCVGGDLSCYGAPRVQLTLLARLDRALIAPEIYYLRDDGGLSELNCFDLDIRIGVSGPQRPRNHVPQILNRLIHLARHSDLVFSMIEGPSLYLSVIAARATGRPLVSWVHNNRLELLKHIKTWHGPVSRFFLPKADHTICVSEGVREDLVASFPSLRDSIEVIPNPVPLEDILACSRARPPDWAAEIFSRPTVLASGRLDRQKGFDLLIRAAAVARTGGADFNVLILGEGPARQELEALAHQLGIRERVFMPGYLSNPFPLYQYAATFVLSSRFEGLPTVLIEALCLDLPIIAFDCLSGPNEILVGGRFGRLVAKEDFATLGNEIGQAVRCPSRLKHFRSTGLQQAQMYSAMPIVRRFERALLGCVDGFDQDEAADECEE
jgi:glycosyltransferase involved in cell wall biosynthesis